MTTITFDTLKFVKTLKSAGFEEKQAEALAEAQTEVFEKNLDELATKRDLKELEQSTKLDIKELEQSTRRDFKELEQSTKRDIKELEQSTKKDIELLQRDMRELEFRLKHDLTLRFGGMLAVAVTIIVMMDKLL